MRRIAISTAGIITALAISVTSAAAARAAGLHSTVADVNLPPGSTQLQGDWGGAGAPLTGQRQRVGVSADYWAIRSVVALRRPHQFGDVGDADQQYRVGGAKE